MRVVALIGVAACGFSGPLETDTTIARDAAIPVGPCSVAATSASAPSTSNLGEQLSTANPTFMHGAMQPPIVCAGSEMPLQLGVYTTIVPVVEGGGERVVRALTIVCGTIAFDPRGAATASYAETIETPYGGCMPAWGVMPATDVTIAPPQACPASQVPIGLTANGGQASLFNTISLACAPIARSGSVGALATTVAITDSGSYTNKPQHATCPSGEAIVGYQWRGNCGVDELTPVCAPLMCQ